MSLVAIGPGANVIWQYTWVGLNVAIGQGAQIGQAGFGYEKEDGEWVRRAHDFGVVLEDDVEIGANTVIDRGRHRDTVVGAGTKIDALVFIAHNVQIGKRCIVIAHAMIAGSAEIGDDVWIGPGALISDHVKVGDGARIGMGAVVLRDVPAGETWVGNPAKLLRPKDAAGGLQRLTQLLDRNRPGIYWRHDVDYDVDCALAMAAFEAQRGVQSTYFFRAVTPLSESVSGSYALTPEIAEKFSQLGHEIGTHVDLRAQRDATFTDEELYDACLRDRLALSRWIGRLPTTRVSFHQPPRDVIGRTVEHFDSAQSAFWQGRYAADSRGVFDRSPEELIDGGGDVQINLHPEWWFLPADEAESLREREAAKP